MHAYKMYRDEILFCTDVHALFKHFLILLYLDSFGN